MSEHNHKSPGKLAEEFGFTPGLYGARKVIQMADDMRVPIYNGKIDRALFLGAAHERGELLEHKA